MISTTILTNARIVLPDAVIHGTAVLEGGRITAVQPGPTALPGAIDCDGDTLMPGIVDLHTDNLERQVQPRSNARWPSRSAMLAHDAQCAAAGVTTVLDALCLGDLGFDTDRVQTFRDGVRDLDALADTGLLKSDHYLHLRCELPSLDMVELIEPVAGHPRATMVSLMDHCPGFGQYADIARYHALKRREGLDALFIEQRIAHLQDQRARMRGPNRQAVLDLVRGRVQGGEVVLASHDDRTVEEIEENHADGIALSEFPVTLLAATAARARGMGAIAGSPNIVRGGSHSGNVSALELVREGAANILASDYVPAALLESAWRCAAEGGIGLPAAVALITANPAHAGNFHDRGRLEPGLRADVLRVRVHEGMPVVREVYRAGERVA